VLVCVEQRRQRDAVRHCDCDRDVHARVALESAVAVGTVEAREVAQRARGGLDHHVVEARRRIDQLAQALAQRGAGAHVDVELDEVVGSGRLRLGRAARQRLLRARRLGDVDVALGATRARRRLRRRRIALAGPACRDARDRRADGDGVALGSDQLGDDSVQLGLVGRARLVGLDLGQRRARRQLVADGDQPLEDRPLLHRVGQSRHQQLLPRERPLCVRRRHAPTITLGRVGLRRPACGGRAAAAASQRVSRKAVRPPSTPT
jgi:hypothetical protein